MGGYRQAIVRAFPYTIPVLAGPVTGIILYF